MDIGFKYEDYQSVRHNLFLYSSFFLYLASIFIYFFILPPQHQVVLTQMADFYLKNEKYKWVVNWIPIIVIPSLISFALTEIFQVHDQWYDKYIIRWRYRYALDFILPKLVQPFASSLNYRFYEAARDNIGAFQEQLYYPFVGDRNVKIPKNKLIRFYEVITLYWLTQFNEFIILTCVVLIVLYRFLGPAHLIYRASYLDDLITLGVFFVLNRLWKRSVLNKVRHATEDEIRAIHDDQNLLKNLKKKLVKLCADYKIPYNETR